MNERVWLQADTSLVNKFLAGLAAIFVFLSVAACSRNETDTSSETEAKSQPGDPSETSHHSQRGVTAIWESEKLPARIEHLALSSSTSGQAFALAITVDGQAHLIDLDGAIAAIGQLPLAADITNGFATQVEDQFLIAFPTINWSDDDGAIPKLTLASPIAKAIVQTDLDTNGTQISKLASSSVSSSTVCVISNDKTPASAELDFLNESATLILSDQQDICPETHDAPLAMTIGDNDIALKIGADDDLVAINGDDPLIITLTDGLSVSAPQSIDAIAALEGRVSVDYPNGLIVLAGINDRNDPRLTFLSARDVAHAMGLTVTEEQFTPPTLPDTLD